MTRVRVTVEGEMKDWSPCAPEVGNPAFLEEDKAGMPHWGLTGTVTAVEQITPPLTAEEALAEIEAMFSFGAPSMDRRAILDIIARTKPAKPLVQISEPRDALGWAREATRLQAERDAAYEALREIREWTADRWPNGVTAKRIAERIAKVSGIGGEK